MAFEAHQHIRVPKHEIITDKQKEALFKAHNITFLSLPKISLKDSGIKHLEPKEGNVVKITRDSATAGQTIFYRGVVNE